MGFSRSLPRNPRKRNFPGRERTLRPPTLRVEDPPPPRRHLDPGTQSGRLTRQRSLCVFSAHRKISHLLLVNRLVVPGLTAVSKSLCVKVFFLCLFLSLCAFFLPELQDTPKPKFSKTAVKLQQVGLLGKVRVSGECWGAMPGALGPEIGGESAVSHCPEEQRNMGSQHPSPNVFLKASIGTQHDTQST